MAVEWNDAAYLAAARQGAVRGVMMAGELVHSEAVRLITSGPKTGRIYRRRGVFHQASAPGQSPASDSGRLAQSGNTQLNPAMISSTIFFSTVYARPLERGSAYSIRSSLGASSPDGAAQREFGTQSLAPRPFLRPALFNMSAQIVDVIAAEIRAAVAGIGGAQPYQITGGF